MTFQAWRRNIEPLMKAMDVPPDVKRDIILQGLEPKVYSRVVLRCQDQGTPEQLIADLEADYNLVVDHDVELGNFFGLRLEKGDDILQYVQRVRLHAEALKVLKGASDPTFDAFQSTVAQIQRGARERGFITEIKIAPPTNFPKLVEAAKVYLQPPLA